MEIKTPIHCTIRTLWWEAGNRKFSFLRWEIMTILRESVTFAFWFIEFCWNPFSKTCPRWKNPVKIFVNLFFSDFEPFFSYLGVFAQNVPFIKKISFARGIFWDQSWLAQTPPTGFLLFKNIIFHDIWQISFLYYWLDVYTSSLKVW